MKKKIRNIGAYLLLTLGVTGLHSIAYAGPKIEHCGIGDVMSIAQAAPHGYAQSAFGTPLTGLPDSLLRCQARLYDDNGPEIPHVWCEQDAFLLGILIFDSYKLLGLHRNTVADFLEQFVHQLSWISSEGTTELEIRRTATKDAARRVFPHILYFQDYTIMGQHGIKPGQYTWEWVQKHPFAIDPGNPEGILGIFSGEVEIVSHQEHLLRVAAGVW